MPPQKKDRRSISAHHIRRSVYQGPENEYLSVGDQPWYCFWNATVEEFWVFLEQDVNPSSTTTSGAMQTSPPSSPITSAPSGMTATATGATYTGGPPAAATTQTNTNTYTSVPTGNPYTWPAPKVKRSSPYSDGNPSGAFPKLVKMVEKRKPHSNIQPYCQQMQVLNNWQIMPLPDVPIIQIEEAEYAQPTGSRNRRIMKKDSTQELESNCICEWFSAPLFNPS